jgi:octaprenyl-diphosphate synthase
VKNNNNDPKKVEEVVNFVRQSNGLQYAEQKMVEYKNDALKMLEAFPSTEYSESLINLVQFTTERKY